MKFFRLLAGLVATVSGKSTACSWHSFPVRHRRRPTLTLAVSLVFLLGGCGQQGTQVTVTTPTQDPTVIAVASIQNYLAGEHAAIWAYGRAAALLPEADLRLALQSLDRHKRERDQLAKRLRAAGVLPVGALVAYDEGSALTTAAAARTFLAGVESRLSVLALSVKSIPSKP